MSQVSLITLTKGIATFVPGVNKLATRRTSGTSSARYCYSVWMRHLAAARAVGAPWPVKAVAELGPGDSIGSGLSAILSGAQSYIGLDGFAFAAASSTLEIFEELVSLFKARAPIPNPDEFPDIWPRVDSYDFPHDLLTESLLSEALDPSRLEAIRKALRGGLKSDSGQDGAGVTVRYAAPWYAKEVMRENSVDMIFSQAVMEHVDNVIETYQSARRWIKTGGFMSQTIDYSSHRFTRDWYGHWTLSRPMWRMVAGRRKYTINRWPHSAHLKAMETTGFRIIGESVMRDAALERAHLAPEFRDLTDVDLAAHAAFIQTLAV
ncbi:MAG TPA: methyltransferase domain-containing protein [Steroidobacteraceae bacterium]|nr:methyltransferase domain-containing protein [Steroidobacteraceae bacterium]